MIYVLHKILQYLKQILNQYLYSRVSYGVSVVMILQKNWLHYNGTTLFHDCYMMADL